MTDTIPLVDLAVQHQQIAGEVLAGWKDVAERGAFVLGPEVTAFEEAFAAFTGVPHCVGVASGTDAIELALRAAGVGDGAEVIVPANTFIASAAAVERAGGVPVLVDVSPDTFLIDPKAVAAAITERTAAVMPVHLYGQLAPMEDLRDVVADRGIVLVEDAAQAQGATRHGSGVATHGVAAGTSFYPGKNLGAYGDAGAVVTASDDIAARVRLLRDHGTTVKYHHDRLGFNSRLDTVQAVVLAAKLARLPEWNDQRRRAAVRYAELLADVSDVVLPRELDGNHHVWHLYVLRVPHRDAVLATLHHEGVGAGIHYPVPVHLQGAFAHLGHRPGDFPVTETAADEILSLPIYPGITDAQQQRVAEALAEAVRRS